MRAPALLRPRQGAERVTLAHLLPTAVTLAEAGAFLVAVIGSAGLWWLYFDRSAEDAAKVVVASADPGRIGRTAYHFIHPAMVAGIIVTALFIAGHAALKVAVWQVVPWSRIAAVAVLGLLGLARLPALGLGACAAVVVLTVVALDHYLPGHAVEEPA